MAAADASVLTFWEPRWGLSNTPTKVSRKLARSSVEREMGHCEDARMCRCEECEDVTRLTRLQSGKYRRLLLLLSPFFFFFVVVFFFASLPPSGNCAVWMLT